MTSPEPVDAVGQVRDWLRQQAGREPQQTVESRGSQSRSEVEIRPDQPSNLTGSRPRTGSAVTAEGERDVGGDPDADPESVGRAVLIRKLAARDRTRHELADAMAAENVPEAVAAGLLDRFEQLGLIDDEAFAQRWVESRQRRRHRSRLALRRELSGKGVDRETIDQTLAGVSTDDELDAARAYVEKVSAGMARLDPPVRRRRLADRLARRGFGFDVISRVLKDT